MKLVARGEGRAQLFVTLTQLLFGGSARRGGESVSRDELLARIAALKSMPAPELKKKWRELFDTEPPPFNRPAQHPTRGA